MAKDPAVLFYTSDFLTGTLTMDNEQVGKYIRLLCLQHQKGRLSEKDMMNICRTYDEDIFSKFIKDQSGKYFNERMEIEAIKRRNYSESRKKNKMKKLNNEDMFNISSTYDEHMENEDVNENKDIGFKEGGTGETKIIISSQETELEPIENRKSKFGGPDYKSVENVFVAKNRPKEEAAIFWNEYESKEWCVHNKEGTGKRKITHNWRYKAENWICGAILEESEKKKNGKSKQQTGASDEFLAKLCTDRAIREQREKQT